VTKDSPETFETSFLRIRSEWQLLHRLLRKQDRKYAPDFNVFLALGVDRRELSHSAFIAELLNPNGSHGQGEVFLKCFLERCLRQGCSAIPTHDSYAWDKWQVFVEKTIPAGASDQLEPGRMDLVLKYRDSNPATSVLIVIENKIDAGEQPDQLKRYSDWLNSQKRDFANRALIYLTPAGDRAASGEGVIYTRLSYREDISGILMGSCQHTTSIPARVTTILEQYFRIVERIDRRNELSTVSDDEKKAFLMRPENLEVALDIGVHIEAAKTKLLRGFWDEVKKLLQDHLSKDDGARVWQLEFRSNFKRDDLKPTNDWYGIDVFVGSISTKMSSYRYTVSQELTPSQPKIHFAVYRHCPPGSTPRLVAGHDIEGFPEELELPLSEQQRGQYVRYVSRNNFGNQIDFLTLLASDCSGTAREIAEEAWDKFSRTKECIFRANEELGTEN